MAPNSITFLVFFFLIFAISRYTRSVTARQHLLAWSSALLYTLWDWRFLPVLLGITTATHLGGILISRGGVINANRRAVIAIGSVLLTLFIFKYINFFITTLASLANIVGLEKSFTEYSLVFPLGISYYTFRAISYLVDVKRAPLTCERKFHLMLLYIGFFPILTAGPITRAQSFLKQATDLGHASPDKLSKGLQMFSAGFVMKAVIADTLAGIAQPVLESPESWSQSAIWIGSIACYSQLYFDFAGYSLMAIGCASWLGFTVPQNFNWPTRAVSISDYWQRWHMTLSSWLRDYLYIPLGGSRGSPIRAYANLFVVMLLSGLWHGPSWNFILWGAMHGVALLTFKAWRANVAGHFPHLSHSFVWLIACWAITQFWILLTRIVFATPSIEQAALVTGGLFRAFDASTLTYPLWLLLVIAIPTTLDAIVGPKTLGCAKEATIKNTTYFAFTFGLIVGIALWAVPLAITPFIYVQF